MDTLFVSSTLEIERESINWRWMQGSVGITSSGLYYPQANYLVNEPKVMEQDYARKNFPMDGFLKKFGKRLRFDFPSKVQISNSSEIRVFSSLYQSTVCILTYRPL